MTIWNAEKVELIKEVQTGCLDGWPIATLPSGLSAWEDVEGGKAFVTVQNLVKPDRQIRLKLGEDRVYALDLSSDGKYLAAAVNQPRIRLWSLETGGELPSLPLQFSSGGGPFIPSDKMIVMRPGAATTVRFSRDSRLLAAGNELAIHVWEIQNGHEPLLLRGPETGIGELVFGSDSSHLYAAYWDGTVRQWRIDGSKSESIAIAEPSEPIENFWLRDDEAVVATGSAGGKIDIWSVPERSRLVRVHILANEKGWIVTTPKGVFDSSEEAWRHASWHFPDSEKSEPVEKYFRTFYEPGLLSEILLKEDYAPRRPIPTLSRSVPEVKLETLSQSTESVQLGSTQSQATKREK